MAEMDMGLSPHKKGSGNKKRRKKKKQNLFMSIVTGLIPWKGDSVAEIFRKIIFLASLAILVVAMVLIVNHVIDTSVDPNARPVTSDGSGDAEEGETAYVIDLKNQKPSQEQIDKLPEGTINEEYAALYDANNDFVGWVNIDGTNVDYPVMQTDKGEFTPCNTYERKGHCSFCEGIMDGTETETEFYLHHDFDRNYLFAGTIFADYEGEVGPNKMPNNTILYGHNMLYRYQFSALNNYRTDIEFLKRNPIIDFNTLYHDNQYKVFAVFLCSVSEDLGDVFDYYNYVSFENSDEFYNYILQCMDRSIYHTGVDIQYGDELLTLSTCDESAGFKEGVRLVVVARKVRENESPEMDTSKIERKSSRKYFEAYTAAYGNRWKGRTWDISLVQGMEEYLDKHGLQDPPEE